VKPRLSSLFGRRRRAQPYPTMQAELDAVRDGAKALALEVWPRDGILDDPDYRRMLELAWARGLQIVQQPDQGRGGVPIVAVYALHPEQAWRIPAHRLLWQTYPDAAGAWSDGAEAVESALLGYSRAQTAAWLADLRHQRLGWRGTTVYIVAPAAALASRRLTGTLLWCDDTREPVRTPPAWLARARLKLARAAVDDATFARLFPQPRRPVATRQIDEDCAKLLDGAAIQVLGRNGFGTIARSI
jgi:hypothetical protein